MSDYIAVEIVRYDDGFVEKHMRCQSEHDAQRVMRGADINLNHARYFTRIVAIPPAEALTPAAGEGRERS